jgi:hypothetical protein
MSMSTLNTTLDPTDVFIDPVAYLAQFGIDAELILVTTNGPIGGDEDLAVAA